MNLILSSKGGVSNLATGTPVHEDNAFRIASVTKTFTGTTVLILASEGLVDLNAPIASYLPEYKIHSGDKITVRMLGNMTSGLFNYSNDPGMWEAYIASEYSLHFSPESLLAIALRYPLNFPPGTQYEYSNTNTLLLGLLIEKVTGKPAEQVIHEKVMIPLKLKNTYFGGSFFRATPYSHGYSLSDEGLIDVTNWNTSWGFTAGAIVSNLNDLKIWARAFTEGTLLTEAGKAELWNTASTAYGFCAETITYKSHRWIGHPGTMPGYNTQMWYNPEKKITLLVNSTTDDNFPAQELVIALIIKLGDL